jgi:phage repressor protein C with HTH and peptisase S24 domain
MMGMFSRHFYGLCTPQMPRISSENSAYSSYQRRIDEVHIIGRVVWFARRL